MTELKKAIFEEREGYDRFSFPENLIRVTAGTGGEAILLDTFEKTALFDTGMAYCAGEMCQNLRKALNGRPLDYIFISHSHYDHMGALSHVQKEFPEAKVAASAKAAKVFSSATARSVMNALSNEARELYSDRKDEVVIGDMHVDLICGEGDIVDLGGAEVKVYETKGHTDCCLSYLVEPISVLFTSESTGVVQDRFTVTSAILKSYDDCVASAEKCRDLHAVHLIIPHYGYIPSEANETYFSRFLEEIKAEKDFVQSWYAKGLSEEEVLEKYTERNWTSEREKEQPIEAFLTNARVTVKVLK